ncbi:MAG: glycosyl hydrolase [Bacteroidales bacterium]|nr:glycosyl hydrolase [Bacteroidales bacterium]
MRTFRNLFLLMAFVLTSLPGFGQRGGQSAQPAFTLTSEMLGAADFRLVGPAAFSGRIADVAVNPKDFSEWYVAVASGGLWKSTNAGTTFTPLTDDLPFYATGCVTIDPNNTDVVWLGSGENNSQRAIGIGDGVYKSTDAGKTWKNMGLKNSAHIGRIQIDPRNSNVVYVAAHGPLWGPGGERGLYKSTNGGETWEQILFIGEYTGINDVEMDPRNPDILYASAHQRERRVYSKINGGPESGLYKSVDAGKTWKKITNGFPSEGNIGRIGIALAKANPDILYAMVELSPDGGRSSFLRSKDKGETWEVMGNAGTSSPQYYQKLITDPVEENTVIYLDVSNMRSKDGGKTWTAIGEKNKHVDNHSLWINPNNNKHYLAGCDGGLYESWDAGANWKFHPHLPIGQFYRIRVDNNYPFYRLYGGTQDNGSWVGPARTIRQFITNEDWRHVNGGDGFLSIPDPVDPTISYHESQNGGNARYDHLLQRGTTIRARPEGGAAARFHWDTPYLVSIFDNQTLYIGAQVVMKSTDRGTTWKTISPDLTRQIDIDTMPLMGKVWERNTAVALHSSTSPFGNMKSLKESPLKRGMLWAGTDDGLIWVTEDDGANWTKFDNFPGVPFMTLVTCVLPSMHDVNTVYATFDGRKDNSNWTPYILKSTDKGKTWKSISSNLPIGSVYTIIEDHVKPDLLFAGTEYGIFVTIDGGGKWVQLKNGLPTIQVPEIDIQRRDNDLVIATFGRGFYIMDDYSFIRDINPANLNKPAHIFDIRDTWQFTMASNMPSQGEAYYKTPNPAIAVNIKYHVKELPKAPVKRGQQPAEETKPVILITITDASGEVVSVNERPYEPGIKAFSWNMRIQPQQTAAPAEGEQSGQGARARMSGRVAPAGKYFVKIEKKLNDQIELLASPVPFVIKELDRELMRFQEFPITRLLK